MKILTIGLDQSILKPESALAIRVKDYGSLIERFIVIAPAAQDQKIILNDAVRIYGVGGNKIQSLFRIYRLAKKFIRLDKYDLISVQDIYFLAFISLILAKKYHLGLEIQVHGLEKFFGLRKLIAQFVLPKADSVRAVSQRLKNQLIKNFNVKENNITVAPIYCSFIEKNEAKSLKKDNQKFVLLTVGRLVTVKNIQLQIRAMTEIVKQYHQAELWIVGEGPAREKLQNLIKKLKLRDKIKIWGWQDDLGNFYQQADIFLLTSDFEGWGLAAIEAANFGLPIIMTDVGCANEVIINQESGLIVPVGDLEKLKETIVKLINDEQFRKKIGEAAHWSVKKLPTKEETLALYKRSWEICLSNKNKLWTEKK